MTIMPRISLMTTLIQTLHTTACSIMPTMQRGTMVGVGLIMLASPTAFAAQQCNTNIYASAPDVRFIEVVGSQGAEVLDRLSNLVWQRCSIGQTWNNTSKHCTGTATAMTWTQALTQAKAQGGDYRLPNIVELQSLREQQCAYPSLNITWFPDTPDMAQYAGYWSSSPYRLDMPSAWLMDIAQGGTSVASKAQSSHYVRVVRGKQYVAP
jgi:hypothetical protein